MATDRLTLDNLTVDCILGDLPEERDRAQPITLALELGLDVTAAALTADLTRTVDYARLEREIRFILMESRFHLIESAALALAAWVLAPPWHPGEPPVGKVRIRIAKPAALATGALPGLTIERTAHDLAALRSQTRTGADRQWRLFDCPDATLLRLHGPLGPATPVPAGHAHADRHLAPDAILRIIRPL